MDYQQQINELERLIHQRMNHLASQDPQCQRFMGRLELLKELAAPGPATGNSEPAVQVDGS